MTERRCTHSLKLPRHRTAAGIALPLAAAAVLALACILVAGCSRKQPGTHAIRIAVLPDLDRLPFLAAEELGYFDDAGLDVELVQAGSAAERDQLLLSGRIDGVITDLVALALYSRGGSHIVAVRHSMTPMEGRPQFRIVVPAAAPIHTPTDLADVPIAVSEGTVIEYVVRRTLAAVGIPDESMKLVNVPSIPSRMSLLDQDQIRAACLPEPLATLAIVKGARPVADGIDNRPFSCSVIAVTGNLCEERPDQLRALLTALDRAAEQINADPDTWQTYAEERELYPKPLHGAMALMHYPVDSVPDRKIFADVVDWLLDKGRLNSAPDYDQAVTDTYLAKPAAENGSAP